MSGNPFNRFWEGRRLRAQAAEFLKAIRKQRVYNADLLPGRQREEVEAYERELAAALRGPAGGLEPVLQKGDRLAAAAFPARPGDVWRENVEVFFVAIVAALALRAYFLQPFKIPTDSMKPTLYGVQAEASAKPPPSVPVRVLEQVLFGRSYGRVVFDHPVTLVQARSGTFTPWIEYTDLYFDTGESRRVWLSPDVIFDSRKLGLHGGESFAANQPVLQYVSETGDQVLVDKFSYNFRLPKRGEVIVFRTNGITGIEDDLRRNRGVTTSEFYIKRCVGAPGDTLRIVPPLLEINGSTGPDVANAAMRRVEAAKDGYHGYVLLDRQQFLRTSLETYKIGPDSFWAMGDNSMNSLDSRFWGAVPRENFVGTGFVVYWPFGAHWGLIR